MPIGDQLLTILTKARARVLDLINEWDTDGNRHIDQYEFHKVVQFMGGSEDITRDESYKIFRVFDEDGMGTIDYGELERLLQHFAERSEPASPSARARATHTRGPPCRLPLRPAIGTDL